ncbi:hypothetical protein WH52_14175 [Tenacibaculum holothuriorum]|uniref:START domain-containing protein n=1 Tax=Tenacibaculum holothuriorum TaxID=1635173 RepID=A0A1Y2P914_9FLAO|nr:hypothetical protein [Tenacibaculum holothuriorum]OSY86926.1 hypothetical protein WH52_14175 [Tenacibaculum holothuriorum]
MKKLIALLLLISTFNGIAQNRNWTTKTSKDGKTTVQYDIIKNDSNTHIYYIVETQKDISLDAIETYFSNSENHKSFLENTTESKKVKKISDNEWVTYYYFDAPWPMPNSDAVLNFKVEKTENQLTFIGNSSPEAYKATDVKRMQAYNITYNFERLNDTSTKLTITADFMPVGSVPKWLLKGWFPKGPAEIANRLLTGASKI